MYPSRDFDVNFKFFSKKLSYLNFWRTFNFGENHPDPDFRIFMILGDFHEFIPKNPRRQWKICFRENAPKYYNFDPVYGFDDCISQ